MIEIFLKISTITIRAFSVIQYIRDFSGIWLISLRLSTGWQVEGGYEREPGLRDGCFLYLRFTPQVDTVEK